MGLRRMAIAALAMFGLGLGTQSDPVAAQPVAKVAHAPLDEISGMAKSRRYADVYWVHNDSGDSARVFAIRPDGSAIVPAWLGQTSEPFPGIAIDGASNSDWEDVALLNDTLVLADVGNNGNARRDLGLYLVAEPNPNETTRARMQAWIPVAYPDQTEFPPKGFRPFDCEAVFTLRGKLYFVTKHRDALGMPARSAALYRLDSRRTDRVNVLKKLDAANNLGGWVTAADVSPNGKTLAVLTHFPESSVWLFPTDAPGDRFLSAPARRIRFSGGEQCEALAWSDDSTILVANEQRAIFRFQAADAVPVKR